MYILESVSYLVNDGIFPKEQLLSILKNHEIFINESKISFVLLGGSTVSSTNGWWSDIDIFIFLDSTESTISNSSEVIATNSNMNLLIDLGIKLEDILATDLVQLSLLNAIPLMVQFDILKNYEPIFIRDQEIFSQFKEQTLKMAIDFSSWQKKWLDESLFAEF